MIENIRGMVRDKKLKIVEEQNELKNRIESMNSEIDVMDQINTALQDDSYFMKITPNDAFGLLKQIGFDDHKKMMESYMELVSADGDISADSMKVQNEMHSDNASSTVSTSNLSFEMPESEANVETEKKYSDKYQRFVEKIENPKEEMTFENEQLMNSCLQAINESVLSDANSYFLGDITISKNKVIENMKSLFRGKIVATDVLPMLTVGMSYGITSDETIMDEILDYLKALQVKAN